MTIVTSPYRVQPGDKLKHWPTAVKALYRDEADDLTERALWPQYVQACRDMLEATSSKQAPWYVVPADDKRNARLIVSQVVVEALAA
jgi:polyphosphate kinase 2 (PPK2 family)